MAQARDNFSRLMSGEIFHKSGLCKALLVGQDDEKVHFISIQDLMVVFFFFFFSYPEHCVPTVSRALC